MQKLYLISILFATIAIPLYNARRRDFAAGLRRTVVQMALFIALWALGCVYVYWHLPG